MLGAKILCNTDVDLCVGNQDSCPTSWLAFTRQAGTQVKGVSAWQVRKPGWMVALNDWVSKVLRHTENNRISVITPDY